MLRSGAHHKFMKLSECCQKQTRLCKQRQAESVLQEFFDRVEEMLIFTLHLRLKPIVQGTEQLVKSFHTEFTQHRHSKQRSRYFPWHRSAAQREIQTPRGSRTPSNPCPAPPLSQRTSLLLISTCPSSRGNSFL